MAAMSNPELDIDTLLCTLYNLSNNEVKSGSLEDTLDLVTLEKMHNVVSSVLDTKIKDLEKLFHMKADEMKKSRMIVDEMHKIAKEIVTCRNDLDLAVLSYKEQVKLLEKNKEERQKLLNSAKNYLTVIDYIGLYTSYANKINQITCVHNQNCVEILSDLTSMTKCTLDALPSWLKETTLHKETIDATHQLTLKCRGFIEYVLHNMISIKEHDNGKNSINLTINKAPLLVKDNVISYEIIKGIEDIGNELNYLHLIMKQVHDMVIYPLLNNTHAFNVDRINADQSTTLVIVPTLEKTNDCVSALNAMIKVFVTLKDEVSLICGKSVSESIIKAWECEKHVGHLRTFISEKINDIVPNSIDKIDTFLHEISEIRIHVEKIELLLSNCTIIEIDKIESNAFNLVISRLCTKITNEILYECVSLNNKDEILCQLENNENIRVHAYAASIVSKINQAIHNCETLPKEYHSCIIDTITSVLLRLANDLYPIYMFTEHSTLSNVILQANDLFYLNNALKKILMQIAPLYDWVEGALNDFNNILSKDIDLALDHQIGIECYKISTMIKSHDGLRSSTFGKSKIGKLLDEILSMFHSVAKEVSNAYSKQLAVKILSKIVDSSVGELATIIMSKDSISEIESQNYENAISPFIESCVKIFTDVSSIDSLINLTPSLSVLYFMRDILSMQLNELHHKLLNGELKIYRKDCVKKLIISLYEDSPTRDKTISLIDGYCSQTL